jgi:hypothetical protein
MACISNIQLGQEYVCRADLDLYKTPHAKGLVTQAKVGRHLKVIDTGEASGGSAFQVCLCEDDYPGWLPGSSAQYLSPAENLYLPPNPSLADITAKIHRVIEFAEAAMQRTNNYLWGGTIGPNFDCSGLIQTAFASIGVVLPRDSYQQEHFVEPVNLDQLKAGDLIFFGDRDRTTHVALHLEDGRYIHSSGKERGRNGIGIDSLNQLEDPISSAYRQQLRGAGRVVRSYQPLGSPMFSF